MHKRLSLINKLTYGCGLAAGLAVGYCPSVFAQVDPYTLCAKSPYNSVCQPHHLNPVALEDQSGEEALACVLKIEETELKGACNYSITPEQFAVYIEEDPELEALGGEKPTRTVAVPTDRIVKLLYEEDTLANRPSLLNIIPAVRVARRALKKPNEKEVALISVIFPNTGQPLSPSAGQATQQQPQPVVVTLVVDKEIGGTVRSQLESITGLPSEAPPAGQP